MPAVVRPGVSLSAPEDPGSTSGPVAGSLADAEGLALGLLAVVGFSLTLPATRAAVPELGAVNVGLGRALVSAALAAALLAIRREPLPARRHWSGLALVALGVVLGFPLLTALALRSVPASHGAVIVGLLPAATAAMAVARAGERPPAGFWLATAAGVIAVLLFAAAEGAGLPQPADLLLLGAVLAAGIAYAEGGRLARELGGWRVICWALVLAAPLVALVVLPGVVARPPNAGPAAWVGFGYVAVVSMFLAFFAWYRAMALAGVARVGQLQLLQPVLAVGWSALLLAEPIRPLTVLAALLVVATVALGRRVQAQPPVRPNG